MGHNVHVKEVTVEEFKNSEGMSAMISAYSKESTTNLIDDRTGPDWDLYQSLEDKGIFSLIAVYHHDTIVGFMALLTTTMPHYSELSTTVESQYVSPEYRPYGTGQLLMDHATRVAKDKGSVIMFMSAPVDSRLSKVAHRFGFKATNTTYSKKIK